MPSIITRRALFKARKKLWTPANIGSSLVVWLDANDKSTLTFNGSNVSAWADKSGFGNGISQAFAGNQPTYTTVNGKGAVAMTGTNQCMSGATIVNGPFNATPRGFFTVHTPVANSGNGFYYDGYGSTTTNKFFFWSNFGNEATVAFSNSAIGTNNTEVLNVPLLGSAYYDGATMSISYNGNSPTTASMTLSTASSGYQIGLPTQYTMIGSISESILLSVLPSSTLINTIQGYLAWKYSIQGGLPSNHPYKLFAPFVYA